MYDEDANASPFNDIPRVVLVLALAMVGVEIVFQLAELGIVGGQSGSTWRAIAADRFALPTAALEVLVETRNFSPDLLWRYVTYPFIHIGFPHMLLAMVLVLALGKFVGEAAGGFVTFVVFFAGSIGGALIYSAIVGRGAWLLGGYPGAYGLIGAFTWILVGRLRLEGANPFRAFQLIGFLILLQLGFGWFTGSREWIADLGSFAVGFLLCAVFRPQEARGIGYLLERLRRK